MGGQGEMEGDGGREERGEKRDIALTFNDLPEPLTTKCGLFHRDTHKYFNY